MAVFGVGGVSYADQVQSVLDQHVLKTTSSADQRDVPLPRSPHDLMGRLRIPVRTPGPNDDSRARTSDPGDVASHVGRHDPDFDRNTASL